MRTIFPLILTILVLGSFPAPAAPFDSDKAYSQTYRIFCGLPPVEKDGKTYVRWTTGSGFLVSNSEYIVTNSHVIRESTSVHILQRRGDIIRVWKAVVYSNHPEQDLAVLKATGLTGEPVTFAEKVPKPAEKVWAVGFPGQADADEETQNFRRALIANNYSDFPANPSYNNYVDPTVRHGTIESIRTFPWKTGGEPLRIITHSANITGGNSGGPLFLENGDLLGVNTAGEGEGNVNGVLIGNIMRKSSLFTEVEVVLDRLGIQYQKRQVAKIEPPTKTETPPKPNTPPKPKIQKPAEPAKKDEKKPQGMMAEIMTFSEENVGYIAIGLGTIVALLALYFGLRSPSTVASPAPPQTPAAPVAHPPVAQPPSFPQPAQKSIPITPVPRPQARAATPTSHPACQIRSSPESPIQISFQINANEIPPSGFILGRSSSVSGRIPHSSVSRTHAKIKVSNGSLYVSDAGSSNGTIVGKKKLEPKTGIVLQNNDTIQLGDVTLIITI